MKKPPPLVTKGALSDDVNDKLLDVLQKNMENIYSGTGEKPIHNVLNRMKDQQQLRPTFKSKAPLKPITAKTVQE